MKLKEINVKLILIFVFLLSSVYFTQGTYSQPSSSECVICPQFVPDCGPDEILVPQSCADCARCESIGKREKKVEKTRESLFLKIKKKIKRSSK